MAKTPAINKSDGRENVGFTTLLEQDSELSGLRAEYAQKPASERRAAAEWAHDESIATSLFAGATAPLPDGGLPGLRWPAGFTSLAIDPDYAPALLTVGCCEYAPERGCG